MSMSLLKTCLSTASKRRMFLVVLSWLFFGAMPFGAVLGNLGVVRLSWFLDLGYESSGLDGGSAFSVFLLIFLFNLLLSGFLVLTACGIAFFLLPVGLLLFRGLVWGVFLGGLSDPLFLPLFPTAVLEGLGYVFAATAGCMLGMSWLKPKWLFKEENLTRFAVFKRTVKECGCLYVFVVALLLTAAIVETVALVLR